jgi:hypothetical protein
VIGNSGETTSLLSASQAAHPRQHARDRRASLAVMCCLRRSLQTVPQARLVVQHSASENLSLLDQADQSLNVGNSPWSTSAPWRLSGKGSTDHCRPLHLLAVQCTCPRPVLNTCPHRDRCRDHHRVRNTCHRPVHYRARPPAQSRARRPVRNKARRLARKRGRRPVRKSMVHLDRSHLYIGQRRCLARALCLR